MGRLFWIAAFAAGCSDGEAGPAPDAKSAWALTLKVDGADVQLPLERMDVYLVDDEARSPEIFDLFGPGVALVGEVPLDAHVGYGEKWEHLFGKTLRILPRGGWRRDLKDSHATLPGRSTPLKVVGGTLTPQKLTGTMQGLKGDRTLHGRVTLQLEGGKSIEGTFAVHAVTLG